MKQKLVQRAEIKLATEILIQHHWSSKSPYQLKEKAEAVNLTGYFTVQYNKVKRVDTQILISLHASGSCSHYSYGFWLLFLLAVPLYCSPAVLH